MQYIIKYNLCQCLLKCTQLFTQQSFCYIIILQTNLKGAIVLNTYQNISAELKSYFSNHPIFKILLPLDMILIFGGVGLLIVSAFISLGSLVTGVAYWAFILGLLLAYANRNEQILYIGFFVYAGLQAWHIITNLKYLSGYFGVLINGLVFAWLGYLVFKKHTLHGSGTQS